MKKSLSVMLAIVLVASLFTGCDKDNKPTPESKKELTSEYDKSTELVGDPNATGELKISYYYPEFEGTPDQLSTAVEKYKKLYPNVLVTVQRPDSAEYSYDNYSSSLKDMLKKADSPDIVFLTPDMEIRQIVKEGLLFNLSDYLNTNPPINLNELNSSVLYDSQYYDKQCFIPLSYNMPILMTSAEIQKEQKFDLTKCTDYDSYSKIIASLKSKGTYPYNPTIGYINYPRTFPWISDMDITNKDTIKTLLNDAAVKKQFEDYKTNYHNYFSMRDEDRYILASEFRDTLRNKTAYIGELANGLNELVTTYNYTEMACTPVIAPWRTANGAIQTDWKFGIGISNKSKNKTNAYNFIKVMLSKEVQLTPEVGAELYNYPVSNTATYQYLKDSFLSKKALTNEEDKKDKRTLFINEFLEYLNQTDGTMLSYDITNIVHKSMAPYYEGQKSYEECIVDAEKKIQTYVFG